MNLLHWIIGLAVLALIVCARIHLLPIPLERDEGEYGYVGQIMLEGVPPYLDADNMKLPGTYAAYALIMSIFGHSAQGIHIGLLLVNLSSIVLMFLLLRALSFTSGLSAIGAAVLGTFTLGFGVLGFAAHATQFVLPFMLGGCCLLLSKRVERSHARIFAAGILFGGAFIMKQHGALFFPMALLMLFLKPDGGFRSSWRRSLVNGAVLATGAAIPLATIFLLMTRAGVFHSFIYWTFGYAGEYVHEVSLPGFFANLGTAFGIEFLSLPVVWTMSLVGLVFVLTNWKKSQAPLYTLLMVVFGFLSICPGGYFRNHYFVTLAPALALLSLQGLRALASLAHALRARGPVASGIEAAVLLFLFGSFYWVDAKPLFFEDVTDTSKIIYGPENPFCEAMPVSQYIKAHTRPSDKIAVVGCEPEIYFLSDRRSGTRFLYLYPLFENQPLALDMQEKMIADLASSRPAYIVFDSWTTIVAPGSRVLRWVSKFADVHYDAVGVVDMRNGYSSCSWGKDVLSHRPVSPRFLLVLKRKDLPIG